MMKSALFIGLGLMGLIAFGEYKVFSLTHMACSGTISINEEYIQDALPPGIGIKLPPKGEQHGR